MLKIVLADDHPIVRQGMLSLLEAEPGWEVIGDASNGLGAVELITELQPDVAIVDVMMPNLNGLDVVERIARMAPHTKVVVLSMYSDQSYVVRALRAGAMAYVLKASSTANLINAIHEVTAGRHYLSPPLTQQRIDEYLQRATDSNQPIDRYQLLTMREREVLHLVAQGETNNQIGDRLAISPRTVETHRANLMQKLQLRSASELHHFAYERGIVGRA